jgi:hypothetical protein
VLVRALNVCERSLERAEQRGHCCTLLLYLFVLTTALASKSKLSASRQPNAVVLAGSRRVAGADLKPTRVPIPHLVQGVCGQALPIVIDAKTTTSIAKWMIHGHADVLDG